MGWAFFIGLALLAGVGWLRFRRRWSVLEATIDDLAAGEMLRFRSLPGVDRITRALRLLETIAAEKERLRRRVEEEHFNLEAILASMVEGVIVVNRDHTIRLINESLSALLTLRTNPVGHTVLSALREAAVEEMLSAALENGRPETREIPLQRAGAPADFHYFAVNAVPFREVSGAPGGAVMVFHDITRLRQLEEIRREFVANVSHELRTPLSIFQGYLENLMDHPGMPAGDIARMLGIMKKHSQRLNALLEDLLALARLEARAVKLDCTDLAVETLLRETVQDWSPRLEAKNLRVEIAVAPQLGPLHGDRLRVEQVLNNLLENAVKFSPEGGVITLSAQPANGGILLRVQDQGVGIPPADLPHIFERFYRVEKARTREGGGTGLGLSIVKHIVTLHGGAVSAESAVGCGTTITIRWPRAAAAS